MLQLVVILKAISEVAMCAYLGQGILYILARSKRHTNLVYTILKTVTDPITRLTRAIAPRFILDQHIGLLAFFLLGLVWVGLTIAKVRLVLQAAG